MASSPHHRTLHDQLRGWSAEQIAALLQRRPDLVQPAPPADIRDLAQRAQHRPSIDAAIAGATLPQNRLLQVIVCCRPDVPLDELERALPEGVGLDDVEEVLAALETAALVWRHGGRVHCSGTLRQALPTTLGPPLRLLVTDQGVDYLKSAIEAVRATLAGSGFTDALPTRARGPEGGPPRKSELIEELESLLAAPGVVASVLASAPPEAAALAASQGAGPPLVELDHYLYFSSYGPARYMRELPVYWLFGRGLLLPFRDGLGAQPREVGMALRGGRPVAELALDRPVLGAATAEPERVDAVAAVAAERTLDRLSDLLERWADQRAKALKSGGLGAIVMKQVAAAMETDVEEAARLVELAHLGGLVSTTTVTRTEKRRAVYESFVGPSPAASAWLERSVVERWRQLAAAWLRAEHWPSASGRKGGEARGDGSASKALPVLSVQYATGAHELRRRVLDVMAELGPGEATSPEALVAAVYWVAPKPWLDVHLDVDGADVVIGWIRSEAESLGVIAHGCLSSFGRALLRGQTRRAEEALEFARPEPVTSFTLQGDLTATVVGALERSVAVELRLLADVESRGAATTLRFSDASLRRAIDAGRDADAILAFLEAHAAKGVPKALAYLVADVARRHGHLQVGSTTSFVTSDDPAVLADACSHRRTRKLALRLLAPTVAVSPKPASAVLDGLRDAGFLPTSDGEDPPALPVGVGGAGRAGRSATTEAHPHAGVLDEPFRARTSRRSGPAALGADAASSLAEAILAGPPPETVRADSASTNKATTNRARADAGDDAQLGEGTIATTPERLAELLAWAADHARVLAVSLADEEHRAPPVIVAVTGHTGDGIVGFDLERGVGTSILTEHVGAAMDVGAIEELAEVSPRASTRSRRGRRR